jgi:predicted Rossmann fold nucleotide-binding protein DprA/Smf involved in DNA uptake
MRVIIAGMRTFTDYDVVESAVVDSGFVVTAVVSGKATGVDYLGEKYAEKYGLPVHEYPADWNRFKRAAGPIRNAQMAANADALVAVWNGVSSGTKNMIDQAIKRGLKVYVKRTDQ